MLENYEIILIPEEAAEILRIGMSEMYRLLNENIISAYKVGRNWRIPKDNLISYIKSKTV